MGEKMTDSTSRPFQVGDLVLLAYPQMTGCPLFVHTIVRRGDRVLVGIEPGGSLFDAEGATLVEAFDFAAAGDEQP